MYNYNFIYKHYLIFFNIYILSKTKNFPKFLIKNYIRLVLILFNSNF